jgi:hypothetical protein
MTSSVDQLDTPALGSGVSLLPVDAPGVVVLGEVTSWSASPAGLVVTAKVSVLPDTAQALSGTKVWASAHTAISDTLVVVTAVARSDRPSTGELELTGLATVAKESRRRAVRAPLQLRGTVVVGESRSTGQTRDLSRTGCRLQFTEAPAVDAGHQVNVEIDISDTERIQVVGRVVRVDSADQELTLRFIDVGSTAAAAIDRIVFEELSDLR